LTLECDEPLSTFAFKVNLRHYIKELIPEFYCLPEFLDNSNGFDLGVRQGLTLVHFSAQLEPCLSQENTLHTLNNP
jgi:hypothetical protein